MYESIPIMRHLYPEFKKRCMNSEIHTTHIGWGEKDFQEFSSNTQLWNGLNDQFRLRLILRLSTGESGIADFPDEERVIRSTVTCTMHSPLDKFVFAFTEKILPGLMKSPSEREVIRIVRTPKSLQDLCKRCLVENADKETKQNAYQVIISLGLESVIDPRIILSSTLLREFIESNIRWNVIIKDHYYGMSFLNALYTSMVSMQSGSKLEPVTHNVISFYLDAMWIHMQQLNGTKPKEVRDQEKYYADAYEFFSKNAISQYLLVLTDYDHDIFCDMNTAIGEKLRHKEFVHNEIRMRIHLIIALMENYLLASRGIYK